MKAYLLIVLLLNCAASAQNAGPPPGRAIPPGYAEADRQARELEKGVTPQLNPVQRPNFAQMQRNARGSDEKMLCGPYSGRCRQFNDGTSVTNRKTAAKGLTKRVRGAP